MKALKQNAGGILMCLFEAAVGVLLLLDPEAFTTGIIAAFGVVLLVMGIGGAIRYFRMDAAEAASSQELCRGLVLIAAGAFCAFRSRWFVAAFPVLSVIYGAGVFVAGLGKIQWMCDMIRMKKKKWFLAAISAALSLTCAMLIWKNPFASSAALWAFLGMFLIAEAAFDLVSLILSARRKKEGAGLTRERLDSEKTEEGKTV